VGVGVEVVPCVGVGVSVETDVGVGAAVGAALKWIVGLVLFGSVTVNPLVES